MPSSTLIALALLVFLVSACGRPARVAQAATVTAFSHETVFPLSTGEHHKNIDCNACHGQFETFTKFDCLGCHTRSETDAMHADDKVSDYAYESASCYRCHPNGDCHPKEECTEHPEDCAHSNDDMSAMMALEGMIDGATSLDGVPAPDAGSGSTTP